MIFIATIILTSHPQEQEPRLILPHRDVVPLLHVLPDGAELLHDALSARGTLVLRPGRHRHPLAAAALPAALGAVRVPRRLRGHDGRAVPAGELTRVVPTALHARRFVALVRVVVPWECIAVLACPTCL